MTEAEAKTKWCPHARVIFAPRDGDKVTSATSYNRSTDDQPLARCLGSGCALWIWETDLADDDETVTTSTTHGRPGCC